MYEKNNVLMAKFRRTVWTRMCLIRYINKLEKYKMEWGRETYVKEQTT